MMGRKVAIGVATVVLLAGSAPLGAAELPARSSLAAVTVYPQGAGVTRIVEVALPAGTSTVLAEDFPAGLDADSIRLASLDAEGAVLESLSARPVSQESAEGPGRELEALQDQRAAIEAARAARQSKKAFIERIARGGTITTEGRTGEDRGQPASATTLREAWTAVGDDLATVNEALRQDDIHLRDIDRKIARLGEAGGLQRMAVRATVTADHPVKARLALTYRIEGASWTPGYEARLDTTAGSLELVRRAAVTQSTGEDWLEAALTVSTARPQDGAVVPNLGTRLVRFQDPEPLPAPMPSARLFKAAPQMADAAVARERGAVLDTAGVQASWQVPGAVTVPSGAGTQLVRLSDLTVKPTLALRTAPALAQTAFLEAAFSEPEAVPLLAGPVSVFRDGHYAGQSSLALAAQGEPVRLGLGADDRIQVTRVATRRLDRESRAGVTSERREFKITLRNGRPDAVAVLVEDAVPVSENQDIRVETLPLTTPPSQRDADDRRGVLVWRSDLAPAATSEIRLGYRISWPANRDIILPE